MRISKLNGKQIKIETHTDLADERANVDHHVEVQEDAGNSDGWVGQHAFSCLVPDDLGLDIRDLLGNQRRDVGLETAGTAAHDDQTDGKDAHGSVGLGDDGRRGGNDEEHVADERDEDGPLDGSETTEVLVGDVGTNQRASVGPEAVD